MRLHLFQLPLLSGAMIVAGLLSLGQAAEPSPTNSAANHMLLNGALGQPLKVPTNAVPANLLPPAHIGMEYQVPQPARGTQVPEAVQERIQQAQQKQTGTELF